MAWTYEQRAAIVEAFYVDGESAGQIAARYQVSRNTIIGLAHRHGKKAGHAAKAAAAPRPRQAKPPKPAKPLPRAWHFQAGKPATIRPARRDPLPAAPLPSAPRRIPILPLGSGECRFAVTSHDAPATDHLFCGLPADGPYCPHHARLAFRPAAA